MNACPQKTPDGVAPTVAFFDLDGTLVIGQTQVLLVKFLRRMKVVSRVFLLGTGLWFLAYKAGLVKVTQVARARGALVFKGLTETQARELMDRFTEDVMLPRLHPEAAAALRRHQAGGDRVVMVSAALEPVVEALSRRLGVREHIGALCRLEGGSYTGELEGAMPYGEEKARVASGLMRRWGADPADCWAYADHETDLALLQAVGHPVAVRPKPGLLLAAEQAGWPVLP